MNDRERLGASFEVIRVAAKCVEYVRDLYINRGRDVLLLGSDIGLLDLVYTILMEGSGLNVDNFDSDAMKFITDAGKLIEEGIKEDEAE